MIIGIYLFYNVIRTIFSIRQMTDYGLDVLIYLIPSIILFFIISQIKINKNERSLIAGSFVSGFLLSIIPGYFLQSQTVVSFSRLSLNWANPNYYASYLLISIGFTIYLWKLYSNKNAEKNWIKYLSLLSLILIIIFLFWTQSRGGILAFLLVIAIFILAYSIKRSKFKLLTTSVIILLILFIGLFYTFQKIRPATITFRERIYKSTFDYITDFWLLGSGLGSFVNYFPKYRQSDYKLIGQEDIITHTHNEFMEQWAETGIIGLLLFLAFIIVIILEAIKKISTFEAERKYFIGACLLSFLLFITHNLFTITMRLSPMQIYFYILAGLIFANYEEINIKINRTNKKKYILFILIPLFLWLISMNISNITGLGYFQRSKEEFTTSKRGLFASIKDAEKARNFIPHNPDLLYHLGYSNFYAKNYQKAIKYFDRLLAISPYYPQAHFWKGYIYSLNNNWNKAINEYKVELKYDQYPKVYFNLAIAYHYISDEKSSINYLQKYVEKIVEKIEKNLVLDRERILSQEKRNLNFAFENLKKYYIDKDKNKISELEQIKKILSP
ncbi:MAG: O-antigen ligase family protein [Candidatus Cloacimonetes bacterium]|nr:O-antigen ligase family protein [Candidatus Cloacimonadota bacterium]